MTVSTFLVFGLLAVVIAIKLALLTLALLLIARGLFGGRAAAASASPADHSVSNPLFEPAGSEAPTPVRQPHRLKPC